MSKYSQGQYSLVGLPLFYPHLSKPIDPPDFNAALRRRATGSVRRVIGDPRLQLEPAEALRRPDDAGLQHVNFFRRAADEMRP